MTFREVVPSRNRAGSDVKDKIRVSFPYIRKDKEKHGNTMIMYLGKDIAGKVGIHGNDKIKFFVDSSNSRIWLIKKAEDDVGYKVMDIERPSGKKSDTLRIQMTWKEFEPNESEIPVKTVKHELYEGGIRIFLQ